MAKKDEVFPSKYLNSSNLNGKPIPVTIESAVQETLKARDGKEQTKTVLYFKGAKKGLPLNQTNWDAVADATGEDDTDRWPGHRIELYPTTTTMQGKTVDCIRIRPPAQRELPKANPPAPKPPVADDIDDGIPF